MLNLDGKEQIFLQKGEEQKDDWSFRRSKWFKNVERMQNVKENVGLLDMTALACAE